MEISKGSQKEPRKAYLIFQIASALWKNENFTIFYIPGKKSAKK